MTQYKTKYKDSYARGSRNYSITISSQASELIYDQGIDNVSAFINDLIIEGLTGVENFFVRQKLSRFVQIKEELEKEGFSITIDRPKKEVK
jgi:hypothetical protein